MSDAHSNDATTIIGPDASIKGHLRFEKSVRLLGAFEGEIASGGELLVAEGATLTGSAQAGGIRVEGTVKGNLQAATKIHLAASARVEGDVQAQRLEVVDGAVLAGRCVIGPDAQAKLIDLKSAEQPNSAVALSHRPKASAGPIVAAKK